jgi:purine-nucleoside phosphorylase
MTPEVERAVLELRKRIDGDVDVLVTLGSGLASVADTLDDLVEIPVATIPGLTVSTVPGHRSVLMVGTIGNRRTLLQVGRVHLYEGHEAAAVTRTVDVAAALGATTFVVTNAAGGLDQSWTPGDLMVIRDHLNLTGRSPLVGALRDGAPVFQDMAGAYDADLRRLMHQIAGEQGRSLREGVYAGLLGPSFETAAEVAMLRTLGAHAVGMSTVLEVIRARSLGMRVAGLSTITNVHGDGVATSHDEVMEVGARVASHAAELVAELLRRQ